MASAPKTMNGFKEHVVDGESKGSLLLTKVTEFWLTVVRTFGALYEASGTHVYSIDDKNTSGNEHSCIKYFVKEFSGTEIFFRKACLRKVTKEPMTYAVRFNEKWRED